MRAALDLAAAVRRYEGRQRLEKNSKRNAFAVQPDEWSDDDLKVMEGVAGETSR